MSAGAGTCWSCCELADGGGVHALQAGHKDGLSGHPRGADAQDYDDPLEKILDYMELVREFDREKLFIFVNLRSFFPDDRVALFLESALGHGFQLLLIDGREYDKLELERRVTVDRDLCEF